MVGRDLTQRIVLGRGSRGRAVEKKGFFFCLSGFLRNFYSQRPSPSPGCDVRTSGLAGRLGFHSRLRQGFNCFALSRFPYKCGLVGSSRSSGGL